MNFFPILFTLFCDENDDGDDENARQWTKKSERKSEEEKERKEIDKSSKHGYIHTFKMVRGGECSPTAKWSEGDYFIRTIVISLTHSTSITAYSDLRLFFFHLCEKLHQFKWGARKMNGLFPLRLMRSFFDKFSSFRNNLILTLRYDKIRQNVFIFFLQKSHIHPPTSKTVKKSLNGSKLFWLLPHIKSMCAVIQIRCHRRTLYSCAYVERDHTVITVAIKRNISILK